ncbi:MAG: hypothetical protein A2498_11065 [Lentisphaerae bacterium RIFOXYC12_FULL_60_16]|nr:MAG: hypothetical protein A2498_11065 [Lentisphaerae bacterium RIFOXYC12_FULL_60_16]OGV76214.1 MAG: hypothetical protein A2340_00140 [Lentisphaerae bacterium RIFOXYB12_FULL_60_10]
MLEGLFASILTTCIWVSLHLLTNRYLRTRNWLFTSFTGYLLSLPLITFLARHLSEGSACDSLTLAFIHGYLWHLLLFFFYVHVYYHVDRSVTLNLLSEMASRGGTVSAATFHARHNMQTTVENRLKILEQNGFIRQVNGLWINTNRGVFYARLMALSVWAFKSKTQSERI